jgi:hypothetical protein
MNERYEKLRISRNNVIYSNDKNYAPVFAWCNFFNETIESLKSNSLSPEEKVKIMTVNKGEYKNAMSKEDGDVMARALRNEINLLTFTKEALDKRKGIEGPFALYSVEEIVGMSNKINEKGQLDH